MFHSMTPAVMNDFVMHPVRRLLLVIRTPKQFHTLILRGSRYRRDVSGTKVVVNIQESENVCQRFQLSRLILLLPQDENAFTWEDFQESLHLFVIEAELEKRIQ